MANSTLANPAPLGLMGFGMTTILLNLHNTGLFAMDVTILAMGIFYGGIAQVLAGLLEFKKNNTFGLTAFTSYGMFWLSFMEILLLPEMGLANAFWVPGWHCGASSRYLCSWGTLKGAQMLQFVFASLTLLFLLLAVAHLMHLHALVPFAGWVGIVCGASACYLAMGEVLNETFGRIVLPIGARSDQGKTRSLAPRHVTTLVSHSHSGQARG